MVSNLTLRQIDKMAFVDAPKIISYYKARLYLGRGIDFYHKQETQNKRWKRLCELNDIYGIMFRTTRLESELGVQVLGILKNELGEPIIDEADPWFNSQIEESFSTNDCAVVVSRRQVDNKFFVVRCFYDREKIVTSLWDETTKSQINLQDFQSKLPKEKIIELGEWDKELGAFVYKHNYGIVPVQVFKNKPLKQRCPMFVQALEVASPFVTTNNLRNVGGMFVNEVSDTAYNSGLLFQLQNLYSQVNKLAILCKPRIVVSNISTATMKQFNQDNLMNEYLDDILIKFRNDNTDVKFSEPSIVLNDYYNSIQSTWSDLFRTAGLSWIVNSGTNKTAQESISAYQGSVEEVNFMRDFQTQQWREFIYKLFKVWEHDLGDDDNWTFQVHKNIITDEASFLNSIILKVNNGFMTKQEGIAQLEGISMSDAKNKLDAIMKEREECPELFAGMNGDFNLEQAQLPGSESSGGADTKQEKLEKGK